MNPNHYGAGMGKDEKIDFVVEVAAGHVVVARGRQRERFPFANETELAATLTSLRDEGLPFLEVDHGWPPGAVFASLRDRDLVAGRYVSVAWTGPNTPIVTSNR